MGRKRMTTYKKILLARRIIMWILIGGMILAFLLPFPICYADELHEFTDGEKIDLYYGLQLFFLLSTPISFMQFWTGVAMMEFGMLWYLVLLLYIIALLALLGILLAPKRIWVYRGLVYTIFGINRIFDLFCLELLVNSEGMIDIKSYLFITPGIIYMLLAIALDVSLHFEKKFLAKQELREIKN